LGKNQDREYVDMALHLNMEARMTEVCNTTQDARRMINSGAERVARLEARVEVLGQAMNQLAESVRALGLQVAAARAPAEWPQTRAWGEK